MRSPLEGATSSIVVAPAALLCRAAPSIADCLADPRASSKCRTATVAGPASPSCRYSLQHNAAAQLHQASENHFYSVAAPLKPAPTACRPTPLEDHPSRKSDMHPCRTGWREPIVTTPHLMASWLARRQTSARSAPLNPIVSAASFSMSRPVASGTLRRRVRRMAALAASSGNGTCTGGPLRGLRCLRAGATELQRLSGPDLHTQRSPNCVKELRGTVYCGGRPCNRRMQVMPSSQGGDTSSHLDEDVQAAGAQQCGVHCIGAVGRAQHKHAARKLGPCVNTPVHKHGQAGTPDECAHVACSAIPVPNGYSCRLQKVLLWHQTGSTLKSACQWLSQHTHLWDRAAMPSVSASSCVSTRAAAPSPAALPMSPRFAASESCGEANLACVRNSKSSAADLNSGHQFRYMGVSR